MLIKRNGNELTLWLFEQISPFSIGTTIQLEQILHARFHEHTNETVKPHFKKESVSRYISIEYTIFIQASATED